MKKLSRILILLSVVSLFAIADSYAQDVVVRVRPRHVFVARPHRPSGAHIWVGEEWAPERGTYVYHSGHWVVPAHPGAIWVSGHWRHSFRGWIWIPGHWR